jgi:type IV secretory pathway TraG/TraD family ATPase VirD4
MPKPISYISTAQTTEQPSFQPIIQYTQKNPSIFFLPVALILMLWLNRSTSNKGKIATSYWAGKKEKEACQKDATAQLKNPKKNDYCLYVNPPALTWDKDLAKKLPRKYQASNSAPTYYFPFAQQSLAIAGKAGSGKTYGLIDPALMSAMDQGKTVILYDFKYPGQAELAIYARRRGYRVYVFAPGQKESCVFNPLQLISSSKDSLKAKDLIKVLSKNCKDPGGSSSGNGGFWEGGGDLIVEGTFLLAKWVAEFTGAAYLGDMLTASLIVSLDNLPARLDNINSPESIQARLDCAQNEGKKIFTKQPTKAEATISQWVIQPLSQFMSAGGTGEEEEVNVTAAGLLANAQTVYGSFIISNLIGSFCQDESIGENSNTLPIDLDGKMLVILGLDQDNREAIAPIIATGLHALISHNVSPRRKRKTGLVVGLDEFPTLNVPSIVRYPAEARSQGFCALLGFQSYSQIVKTYGEESAKTIIGSCGTKVLFDPGEFASAEIFSKMLGDIDVEITQKSTSSSSGGGSGSRGSSTTKVLQQRPLISPTEFLKLPRGEAIVLNPGYSSDKESNIPLRVKFKVSPAVVKERQYCSDKWNAWVTAIQEGNPQLSEDDIDRMINERKALVDALFPKPIFEEDEEED